VWSRLGAYPIASLDHFTARSGEMYEYWGHVASLLPVARYPLFRWRMDAIRPWPRVQRVMDEHPGYVEMVFEEIAAHGPLTVSDLSDPGARTGPWWGHGKGKTALDWLFSKGRIAAYRNASFGRLYDLPERVIPAEHLEAPAPERTDAYRELLLLAARHHGVGTATDIGDYYRLHLPTARPLLEELADSGALQRVEVTGWGQSAYLHPEARLPRQIEGATLLSPFDSLVWERSRTERIFGFHYRIEIYVPEPQRVYGYYVLPFLLDGELVGRVDLKADRKTGALLVRGSFHEEGTDPARVVRALAPELNGLAGWLGLGRVQVDANGSLAGHLARLV